MFFPICLHCPCVRVTPDVGSAHEVIRFDKSEGKGAHFPKRSPVRLHLKTVSLHVPVALCPSCLLPILLSGVICDVLYEFIVGLKLQIICFRKDGDFFKCPFPFVDRIKSKHLEMSIITRDSLCAFHVLLATPCFLFFQISPLCPALSLSQLGPTALRGIGQSTH